MTDQAEPGQRIAKVMARAGLCSRRDAEQWIAEGRVSVNGEVLTSPARNVTEADDVRVDGAPLRAAERTRLFLFHKPRGLVTTAHDPEGRPTIFDALPSDLPRVVAVGRLDINTEGLLLLTNDGGLARVLELPATGWLRRYRVRAHGQITQEQLDSLRDGVSIDGVNYLGIEAKFERQQGANVWLTMGLREGKNREIKRVLEHMGLSVNRLIRISFGPFELADLAEGEVEEVRTRVLRDQLGPKLARQAGVNFEGPTEAPALVEAPRERAPRQPRPEAGGGDAPPRKRKHVSVLREEARAEAAGPRKRVARASTTDRKGREVKIERISLVNPPPPPRRAPRREAGIEERARRPARSFGRDAPTREGAARRERSFGERPARDAGRRPARSSEREAPAGEGAPRRERSFGERPARDAGRRPARSFDRDAPARESAPRRERSFGERPSRDAERRPARSFDRDAPARDGAPRRERSFGERPARDAGRRPARSFDRDAPNRETAPRRERSFSERPGRDAPARDGAPRRAPGRTSKPRDGGPPPRGKGPPRKGPPRGPRGR